LIGMFASAAGCATRTTAPVIRSGEPWPGRADGRVVRTEHYEIRTTSTDAALVDEAARTLEAAYRKYAGLVASTGGGPRVVHLFARRDEWEQHTKHETGPLAAAYLRIHRGGYTAGDAVVCYDLGPRGTLAVLAHEGWHQHAARTLRQRPPPFIEEGVGTLFEGFDVGPGGTPRWSESARPARAARLAEVVGEAPDGSLLRIEQLVTLHAGDVMAQSPEYVETFYLQAWAFAHYLVYGDDGAHRGRLARLLADCTAGRVVGASADGRWSPDAAGRILRAYFGDPATLEIGYRGHLRKLAGR
jgi:hypothetical protein